MALRIRGTGRDACIVGPDSLADRNGTGPMAEFRSGTTAEHAFAEHEHRDLAPGINRIHAAALAIPSVASYDCSHAVLSVIDWVGETPVVRVVNAFARA